MLNLSISVDGVDKILRKLDHLAVGVKSFKTPLKNSVDYLKRDIQQNYGSRGGRYGRWPVRLDNHPWPLLQKTGRMRNAFKSRYNNDEGRIWNTASYFPYHQRGTGRVRQRKMMEIDSVNGREVVKIFQKYLVDLMRK